MSEEVIIIKTAGYWGMLDDTDIDTIFVDDWNVEAVVDNEEDQEVFINYILDNMDFEGIDGEKLNREQIRDHLISCEYYAIWRSE